MDSKVRDIEVSHPELRRRGQGSGTSKEKGSNSQEYKRVSV